MFCKKCGFDVTDGEFCPNCGTLVQAEVAETGAPVQAASDPGKAKGIVALIMGILSLVNMCSCGAGIVFAIVGMILGSSGFNASAAAGFENKMAKTGKTLSIVGLILSILGILFWVLYYVFIFVIGMGGL